MQWKYVSHFPYCVKKKIKYALLYISENAQADTVKVEYPQNHGSDS